MDIEKLAIYGFMQAASSIKSQTLDLLSLGAYIGAVGLRKVEANSSIKVSSTWVLQPRLKMAPLA
jgi:hypothetical protein